MARIIGAILRSENSILTVSTLVEGRFGVPAVCMSLPSRVNAGGVERIICTDFSPEEEEGLEASAKVLRGIIDSV